MIVDRRRLPLWGQPPLIQKGLSITATHLPGLGTVLVEERFFTALEACMPIFGPRPHIRDRVPFSIRDRVPLCLGRAHFDEDSPRILARCNFFSDRVPVFAALASQLLRYFPFVFAPRP